MNFIILIQFVIVYTALSSAAVFRSTYKHPDHPDKCVLKELNLVLSPGDIVPYPGKCLRLMCFENNLMVGHSCGVIGPPDGCVLGERLDAAAPYPECCQRDIICNNIEQ